MKKVPFILVAASLFIASTPSNSASTPNVNSGVNANALLQDGRVVFRGRIRNRLSGKCIDIANQSSRNKANVQQWSCAPQANQRFEIVDVGNGEYAIVNRGSSKVLDVEGESRNDAANIQQFSWNSGGNQRWRFERRGGQYLIINSRSGKCLDVANHSRADGANIQQYSCHGEGNQQWRVGY